MSSMSEWLRAEAAWLEKRGFEHVGASWHVGFVIVQPYPLERVCDASSRGYTVSGKTAKAALRGLVKQIADVVERAEQSRLAIEAVLKEEL
jgi:hypothetical protein